MALKQCIQAFAQNSPSIPYRNSMLTRLLKDCMWEANAQVAVIATISPIPTDTEHTLATLHFAALMQNHNYEVQKTRTEVENLELKALCEELSVKEWDNKAVCEWFGRLQNRRTN